MMKLFLLTLLVSFQAQSSDWACEWFRNDWGKADKRPSVANIACGGKEVSQCIGVVRCFHKDDHKEEFPDFKVVACALDSSGNCGRWTADNCRFSTEKNKGGGIKSFMTIEEFAAKRLADERKKVTNTLPRNKSDDQPHDSDVVSKNQ